MRRVPFYKGVSIPGRRLTLHFFVRALQKSETKHKSFKEGGASFNRKKRNGIHHGVMDFDARSESITEELLDQQRYSKRKRRFFFVK